MQTPQQKVETDHLQRDAYLYVRQSTLRQVIENNESTQRQYALRQKAVTLGWQPDQVVVIAVPAAPANLEHLIKMPTDP